MILFFRLGDFCEMFNDDAIKALPILENINSELDELKKDID
jgi:DNA mismatch repair ATPase MutS